MKFCISLGNFELKYFFYCFLFVILSLFMSYFIYCDHENIIKEHYLLHSFCFFLGYLLNIIPFWISLKQSKGKEKPLINKLNKEKNYSKEILKILFICLILLLADIIENIGNKIENNDYSEKKQYNDDYFFIEYLIIFIVPKLGKEVYYKHQYISFLILILVEIIKNIYFFIKNLYKKAHIISVFINIIYSILYSIYYLYIKGLMKYKFISPYKCNFMIGVINFPIIILISFIISFTSLGNTKNYYYYDNIFELFKNIENINAKNIILLILAPFAFGIYAFILIKIIYDYSIFHIYIPIIIQYFIENIVKNFDLIEIIFLISSFFIELIFIFVFVEIIEINCCGLNKNLKRNIQSRGTIDSSLAMENNDDDERIDKTTKL